MKLFKRSLSVLLAGLMAFSQPLTTLANTETVEPTYVGGERLEDVPEGNYVYLGNTAVTLREGNGSFSIPIYREGDTSERAWVKIHTIDLTSVYGRDYRVEGKHRTEHAGRKNIFQLLAEEDNSDSTELKTYEFELENKATPSEAKKSDSADSDADKQASAQSDDVKSESTKSDDKFEAKDDTAKTDAEASRDNAAETEALDDGFAAEDDIAAYDDDFAVGGFDDEFALDEGYAVDDSEIDINDDNLEVRNLKEISSDSISNSELAAKYNESAAKLNNADNSTAESADEDSSSVIVAPKKATATEFLDDSEAAQAEVIDQKAVVDADTDSSEDDGISELAKLKYEQTGIPTREGTPTGTVNANITDQIFGAIAPEYMGLISYSCEQTIYLEPGEDEADFTFRLYDNLKSDGSRMFSVIIAETSSNIETYKATNMSVLIEDDEET